VLKRFKTLLVCLVLFGWGGSAFAQNKSNELVDSFNAGIDSGATHMLVVWDTWDFEDSYYFFEYSYPGEDVNDLIKHYDAPGFYRVSAVFALHLDLNEQLREKRWYPEYP
jgi:hypothetical protein